MKVLIFYLKLASVWLWFFVAFLVGTLILPFRWRDPSVGVIVGSILNWGVTRFLRIRIVVENREALTAHQPCIYVGNHQHNLDIHTLSGVYPPNTVVIGKKELRWIPILGFFFMGSGYILLDRGNQRSSVASLVAAGEEMRRRHLSVWFFPEGHRAKGAKHMLPFKKGAFRLAIKTQTPIVPVLHQHLSSYYDFRGKRIGGVEIRIRVLDPISTKGLADRDVDRLMRDVRARMEAGLAELNARPVVNI